MQTKRRGKLVKNWTTIRLNGGSTKPSVRCACGHQPTASTDDVMQRRERNLYRMFIGAARPQMSVSRRRLAGARLTDGWRQPPTQPARPPASLPAVYMPAVDQSLLTAVVVDGSPAGRPAAAPSNTCGLGGGLEYTSQSTRRRPRRSAAPAAAGVERRRVRTTPSIHPFIGLIGQLFRNSNCYFVSSLGLLSHFGSIFIAR